MVASAPARFRSRAVVWIAPLVFFAGPAPAQDSLSPILPWEVNVAEIEAGRLRGLVQRLNKQNLLYQLRLGEVRKDDIVETTRRIDRVIGSLEQGSPSYSIPAPWTPALRERVAAVDLHWGPLRRIAVASPYDTFRLSQQFVPRESRRGDPLLLRYFDDLCITLVAESEKLLDAYHAECVKTEFGVCETARTSGYAAMLIERAAKEAVSIVAGIQSEENRKRLDETIEAYAVLRKANQESPFFADALNPERGPSARAAGELLASLRRDWDDMQVQLTILEAGDVENFDLRKLLTIQSRLVAKVERMTAALVRYASLTYGS